MSNELRQRKTTATGSNQSSSSGEEKKASNGSDMKQFILFNVSGGIGTALFAYVYNWMYMTYPWGIEVFTEARKASLVWFLAYGASITWQHALHRVLVFREPTPYFSSLMKTYVVYSFALAASTFLNGELVNRFHLDENIAWVGSLVSTGVINFYATKLWAFSD